MKKKEDRQETPPDSSEKKDGVTSTFSAATGEPGRYGGEDLQETNGSIGTKEDMVANRDKEDLTGKE